MIRLVSYCSVLVLIGNRRGEIVDKERGRERAFHV